LDSHGLITSAKLDQVHKYRSLTEHVYSPAIFLMNKAQWDKLSDADKQAFVAAAKEGVKANRARVDEDERKAVADLARQRHAGGQARRQGEVPGSARAGVGRFRQAIRAIISRVRDDFSSWPGAPLGCNRTVTARVALVSSL